ncbi:MAG TPA: hypothetical protein VFY06_16180 [Verrucomicrobiae bacterium]|nr:hypothetical protein [Verrucomicrobiae bacterium]
MTRDEKTRGGRRAIIAVARHPSLVTGCLFAGALLLAGCKPSEDGAATSFAPLDATNHSQGFTSLGYYPAPNQLQVKMRLSGTEAQPLPGGLLLIKQPKLESYRTNGALQAVIEAPECIYDTQSNTVNSAGHLHLQNADGTLRTDGDGFLWRQDDSSLTISNHVHTVIVTGSELKTGL